MEIAVALAAGTSAAMGGLKSLLKGKDKNIPPRWKIPTVAALSFLGSMIWFNSKNALSWSNWVDVVAVTAMTVFLAVLWHQAQRGDSRRN